MAIFYTNLVFIWKILVHHKHALKHYVSKCDELARPDKVLQLTM